MVKYIFKRLLYSVITIWCIVTITFFLMKAIPGEPFASEKLPNAVVKAAIKSQYGFDKPIYIQYLMYLKNFVKLDFGVSFQKAGLTVSKIIREGFPYSFAIGVCSCVLVVFVGVGMGVISALRQNKLVDRMTMILSTLFSTIPSFVLATGFLYLFSKTLGWVPSFGVDNAMGYIGPVVVIGTFSMAFVTRLTRTSILEVLQQDYIRTARAKGISEARVITKHALRNALLPVITYIGPMIASVVTGSFVVEKVFGIPGIGKLFTESIINRDYTLIMGITTFFAVFLVITVLIVDVAYVLIDPRIKYD